jgi:hypothetical protein
MGLFNVDECKVSISAAFARQRFLCSTEYSAGVCHGACCSGPSVVLLTEREAADLKAADPSLPVYGRVLAIRGKRCPLALPNGHCKFYGTKLKSFVCTIMPFCLNNNGKLILDNGFMKRGCRVRNGVDGGEPAYRCFGMALVVIFGEEKAKFITEHFDNGGGDITVPVSKEVMETLVWHRGVINDIKKFGYKDTVTKLAGGIECL